VYDRAPISKWGKSMLTVRVLAIAGMVCGLAACVTPTHAPAVPQVNSQVTTFHQLPTTVAGMKFAFALVDNRESNLEFATYAAQIRMALSNLGLIETDIRDSDLAVAFAYTIDTGKPFLIDTPIYGQTGVSGSSTTGSVNDSGRYDAITTYAPTYGITGYRYHPARVYTRQIIIRMVDNKRSGNGTVVYLYKADVVSTGFSDNLVLIVPRMLDAVFTEFPGGSGTVRRVSIPCPACDRG
jgi:Domain of unknown function (DUF4136)